MSLQDMIRDSADRDEEEALAERTRKTRRSRRAHDEVAPSQYLPGRHAAVDEPQRGGGAHALKGALRYEWLRLRTLRSTWWLLVSAVAINALIAWVVARSVADGEPLDTEAVVTLLTGGAGVSPLSVTAVLVGIVGVLALGQEYRHDVIRTTLCAVPRRGIVLAAKVVVVGLWAAFAAVLAGAAAYGVGRGVIGPDWRVDLLRVGDAPRALGGFIGLVALTALLGLALAGLFRSVPAALVVLLLTPLAFEPLADVVLQSEALEGGAAAGRYMPFTAAQQMIAVSADQGEHAFVPLAPVAGGLLFLGYVVALVALAAVLLSRRDA